MLTKLTSASPMRLVETARDWLLLATGSIVDVDATFTEFETEPDAAPIARVAGAALVMIFSVELAPLFTVPKLQTTGGPATQAAEPLAAVVAAVFSESPGGKTSVTVTPFALLGPALETWMS